LTEEHLGWQSYHEPEQLPKAKKASGYCSRGFLSIVLAFFWDY
jgi:hypothetical protein